jgi:uncharacterized protein (TIGR00369 family)
MTATNHFAEADGYDVLLAMQRGELPQAEMTRYLGIELETVERGHIVYAMTPREDLYNLIGSVHGGIVTTLLDTALGTSVQSLLPPGKVATTMDLHTRFHRPVTTAVSRVFADARAVHVGKRTATSEARLIDADGKIYATATSTLMIIDG